MTHPSIDTALHAASGVDTNSYLADAGVAEPYRPPYLQRFDLSSNTQLGTGGSTDAGTPGQGTS